MSIKDNRKPKWLKIKLSLNDNYNDISNIISKNKLNTVCSEARCPNIYECWNNRTATIMILGDTCTRACGFCSVKTGKPNQVDILEPIRVAEAAKKMDLRHIVITSVDRDDLRDDYGATIWAETINRLHSVVPNCSVEVLTPDFKAYEPSLQKVFDANPSIFSHNIECVKRISRQVRKQSRWSRSKRVLELSVKNSMLTKTGLMVGLGETNNEVIESMKEMADLGVEIFNIGQYLQPTKKHLEVQRYVHPDEFKMFKEIGLDLGFKVVESGPLVRSSYHADKQAKLYRKQPNVAS
jgi:lipoic acid synthetase|tara:strand:+ start:676 stop:1560 length:885 start_codon:yes stop_codon:yes gene_type:complete